MPNMAVAIAKKAKWYHVITLNSRVSVTSNASVAQAIRNVMVIEAEDYATHTFHARFVSLPEAHQVHLRKIRSSHIGKLISVNGILTRSSEVKPQLTVGIFECRVCQERMVIPQDAVFQCCIALPGVTDGTAFVCRRIMAERAVR